MLHRRLLFLCLLAVALVWYAYASLTTSHARMPIQRLSEHAKVIHGPEVPFQETSHPGIQKQVLVHKHVFPGVTQIAKAVFKPGQTAKSHVHKHMGELFYVLSGRGTFTLNGTPYAVEPGVTIIVQSGDRHEVANAASATEDLILLLGGFLDHPSYETP